LEELIGSAISIFCPMDCFIQFRRKFDEAGEHHRNWQEFRQQYEYVASSGRIIFADREKQLIEIGHHVVSFKGMLSWPLPTIPT
jgi:hypothetical protein